MRIFFLFCVLSAGCHRTLQVGAGYDASTTEPDAAVVLDGGTSRDTSAIEDAAAWYVEERAYVGEELRLPVPENEVLVDNTAVTRISTSVADTGELLVAYSNRVWRIGANGETATALDNVAVADQPIFLTSGAPIALSSWNQHAGRRLSWAGGDFHGTNLPFQVPSLSIAARLSNVWSATNSEGKTLVEVGSIAPHAMYGFPSGTHGGVLYRAANDPAPPFRTRTSLLAHNADFWRVTSKVVDSSRSQVLVQRWDAQASGTDWDRWFGGFSEPVLTADPPGNPADPAGDRMCRDIYATSGDDRLFVLCTAHSGWYYRIARFEATSANVLEWQADWSRISLAPGSLPVPTYRHDAAGLPTAGVLWDAVTNRFVAWFAVGNTASYSVSVRAFTSDGALWPRSYPDVRDVREFTLLPWQGKVWGVAVATLGTLRVIPVGHTGAEVQLHHPGSQALTGLWQRDQNVLVSWSDSERTFVSALQFSHRLAATSRVTQLAANAVWMQSDGDPLLIRTATLESDPAAGIARVSPETLTMSNYLFPVDLAVHNVSRQRAHIFALGGPRTPAPFLQPIDEVRILDAELHPLRIESVEVPEAQTRSFVCDDAGCLIAGRFSSGAGILSYLDAQPASVVVRPWTSGDGPACGNTARQEDGSCPSASTWRLPDAPTDHHCSADAALDQSCELPFSAYANSPQHTLVAEVVGNTRGDDFQAEEVRLRLLARGTQTETARLSVPSALLQSQRQPIHLVHVKDGLFALVYGRNNATIGRIEAFARIVYFPEANAAP